MAVNEIGVGGFQNVVPGNPTQGGRLTSKDDSFRNLGNSEKEEIFKVELSSEAIEMAKVAKEKEIQAREDIQQEDAVLQQARQQKKEESADAAEIVQREKIDITV